MRLFILSILLTCVVAAQAQKNAQFYYVYGDQPALSDDFKTALEEQLDADVQFLNAASDSLPPRIAHLPALVSLNGGQWSYYNGPVNDLERMQLFADIVRIQAIPWPEAYQDSMWYMARDGYSIILKTKVTLHNEPIDAAFKLAWARFAQNNGFQYGIPQRASSYDRTFYFDFYPHVSDQGALWLSHALYSQFDCVEPVSKANAEAGEEHYEQAFFAHSETMWRFVQSEILNGGHKFGWYELNRKTKASLQTVGQSTTAADWQLPEGEWRINTERSQLLFHFPAPLDRYVGRFDDVAGELVFANGSLSDAQVKVANASLNMGDLGLNDMVINKILQAKEIPFSTFALERYAQNEMIGALQIGDIAYQQHILITGGTFIDDNSYALSVRFFLNTKDQYGIDGPDGPEAIRQRMEFYGQLILNRKT